MTLVSDEQMYRGIDYPSETVEYFIRSYTFYGDLLKSEVEAVKSDSSLNELLGAESGRMTAIEKELQRIERFHDFHTEQLKKYDQFFVDIGSVSHGSLRFMKSVGLLYLAHLKEKRNNFSQRQNISVAMLHDMDRNLSTIEEIYNTGVMTGLEPLPLIADQTLPIDSSVRIVDIGAGSENLALVSRPRPVVIASIEIFDTQLRSRCLDLLAMFQENGEPERLDQVISEATRILEDRLRSVLGDTVGTDSNKLIEQAFGNNGSLFQSAIPAERLGLHALFRGTFGHIRNPAHHRLNANMTAERVLQIVGFVDYLLSVLASEANDAES